MTIAEVSEKYDIPAATLRYYEKIGLLPRVGKKNGIRDYSEEDCNIKARKQLLVEQRRDFRAD